MAWPETALVRPSLTGTLIEAVRKWIFDGRLTAERPLVEAELARELGVSRTPLREALVALERDGFVTRIPNRGFFVAPLSPVEAQEIYPLVGALEATALRNQGDLAPTSRARLESGNRELRSPKLAAAARLRLDGAWHELLLAACPNRKLHELLVRLKYQLHRYEYAFMAEAGSVTTSVREHGKILAALRRGDVERAALLLESHWQAGAAVVVAWLNARAT